MSGKPSSDEKPSMRRTLTAEPGGTLKMEDS
jgi:hypothetical protein